MDKWKDDIERYLNGKMTPAEKHALEKKALSDPFLADALEGAESVSAADFTFDVNELNQKIAGEGKIRWVWPLRIAASVVGIALVSTAILYSVRKDDAQIANSSKPLETKTQEEKKSADTLLVSENESGDEDKDISNESSEVSTTGGTVSTERKPEAEELIALKSSKETKNEGYTGGGGAFSAKPATASTAGPSELQPDSGYLSGLSETALATTQTTKDSVVSVLSMELADFITSAPSQQPIAADDEAKVSRARKTSPVNMIVNGQVRDQEGQPIPGVNILIKGSGNGTVTNAEGKYSIALSDQNQTLVYSFIGFVAQEQPADKANAGDLNVQLQEDATQLSEVVVTGYSTKKSDGEPVVRLAEPIGGRKAYDQYLDDKKLYPQQALDNKVEGKVIVEFTVTTTGAVTDFNVVRKLGYGCEEEVIRLVKEGPKWYPTYIDNEAVESLVRVKTRFDLPGKK